MRFGPYLVERELGRGGAGTVLRAHTPDGRVVALKVLHRNDSEALARFDRERRLLASLGTTEGFVPLLDAGSDQGRPYIVMPFVSGGSLRDRLNKGALEVRETLALGRALAGALAVAHERGIVHRDLKPENVLFEASGAPLIADLGLGKHFSQEVSGASLSIQLSKSAELRGTIGYMPPEQMKDARAVDARADVFALGAILYECLAGTAAFNGDNMLELLANVESGVIPPLREAGRDVPAWFEKTIRRALSSRPEKRFADAAELEQALFPPAEERESSKAPLVVGTAVALVLVVGAAVRLARGGSRTQELIAHARALRAAGDTAGALVELDRIIAQDPLAGEAFFERAVTHEEFAKTIPQRAKDEHLAAEMDVNRAIELDPRSAKALYLRGCWKRRENKPLEAVADQTRAIEIEPALARAWYERGMARPRSDLDAALADMTRSLELDPKNAHAWQGRGVLRSAKDDGLEQAIADEAKALELDPDLVEALETHGSLLYRKGLFKEAIVDFDRILKLQPKYAVGYRQRALLKERVHDFDGAMADAKKAIELDPSIAEAWTVIAACHMFDGKWPDAVTAASRAVELDPSRYDAWLIRGRARGQLQEYEGACADFERACVLTPKDGIAIAERGRAYFHRGELRKAVQDLSRAIEIDPKASEVNWVVGTRGAAREKLGDLKGAIEDFTRLVALEPNDWRHLNRRAGLKQQDGRSEEALDDYGKAIQLAPREPALWSNRAAVYAIRGRDEADARHAIDDLTRAIELDPQRAMHRIRRGRLHAQLGEKDAAIEDMELGIELAKKRGIGKEDPRELEAAKGALAKLKAGS